MPAVCAILVTVEVLETVVVDAEVVRELVHDCLGDDALQLGLVMASASRTIGPENSVIRSAARPCSRCPSGERDALRRDRASRRHRHRAARRRRGSRRCRARGAPTGETVERCSWPSCVALLIGGRKRQGRCVCRGLLTDLYELNMAASYLAGTCRASRRSALRSRIAEDSGVPRVGRAEPCLSFLELLLSTPDEPGDPRPPGSTSARSRTSKSSCFSARARGCPRAHRICPGAGARGHGADLDRADRRRCS